MQHHQRSFPPEFKQEAVRLLETSGTSGIQIAKDLGISDTILYRGRKGRRVCRKGPLNGAGGSAPFASRSRNAAAGARYFKKGRRHLHAKPAVKYQFIAEH